MRGGKNERKNKHRRVTAAQADGRRRGENSNGGVAAASHGELMREGCNGWRNNVAADK